MGTVEGKILREQVQEGLWELSDENLERVLCYMGSLPREEERDIPEVVVSSAVRYTLDEIERGGRFYSTEEVFDCLNEEMGWRWFGQNSHRTLCGRRWRSLSGNGMARWH